MKTNAKVYVMRAADGRVKLGHSRNPERRAQELGCVELAYSTQTIVEAERVERLAHRVLALHGEHCRGEWFEATVENAIFAIETALKQARDELPLGGRLKPHNSFPEGSALVPVLFPPSLLGAIDEEEARNMAIRGRSAMIRALCVEALAARAKRR